LTIINYLNLQAYNLATLAFFEQGKSVLKASQAKRNLSTGAYDRLEALSPHTAGGLPTN